MGEKEVGSIQTYNVKLSSGRVLGPLDLDRITQLIKKKQITGEETARVNPVGEWKPIAQFPEIVQLLMIKLDQGTVALDDQAVQGSDGISFVGETRISGDGPVLENKTVLQTDDEATQIVTRKELTSMSEDSDKTKVQVKGAVQPPSGPMAIELDGGSGGHSQKVAGVKLDFVGQNVSLSREKTILAPRSLGGGLESPVVGASARKNLWNAVKGLVLVSIFSLYAYQTFFSEQEPADQAKPELIRPKLPVVDREQVDPGKSIKSYEEGIRFYVSDTVFDYKMAAEKFRRSVTQDPNNVKSLAMLASAYLNLIDSSNKDEIYFDVLSRLIEMSRAKSIDLPETVIADVEFFIVANKTEAAQTRVIEYTKTHSSFGPEMFYYLALSYFSRGDYVSAARFIERLPDNKVFSAKVFFLKGQIAEKLKDVEAATQQYNKAIALNSKHVKSRLRLAWIMNDQNKIGNAAAHLNYSLGHVSLLSPKELGEAYYLHSQLMSSESNWKAANDDIEMAVFLEPENQAYLLEMYTLKARAGTNIQLVQSQARMYYFLGEGERLVQLGKYQEALSPFLQSRQFDDKSPIPLLKMGDMFSNLHDVDNARRNYKLAAERAPNNIQIWSKYIKTLIQSYEWDEAKEAMARFRKLPVSQSAIDKAAADMYQQQGRYVDAQTLYKKAMGRPSIDPEVYIAYAKSLMSTKNFKDAPFFFALALRFDPLNVDAKIGTAKCVAETESIDAAIGLLQDELKGESTARAEYLAGIAELQMQKGDSDLAQENIKQAIQVNPDYAYPWKLQAQIYAGREFSDRKSLDQALVAYKSFSDRNLSDPSGYLERYKIFVKRTEFEKAKDELNKIYEIYPKYPNLHYFLGALYAIQGNHKVSIDEFKLEVQNNPVNLQALIAYGKELLELNDPVSTREALKQFIKAMEIAPQSADAKQNAGWANFKLQNYTAAIVLIKEAISLDQANPAHYRRLGLVYRDAGDIQSACASFRKYLEMEPDATDRAQFRSCF
jgi:tetratricopeptide (TPR) repeat protein